MGFWNNFFGDKDQSQTPQEFNLPEIQQYFDSLTDLTQVRAMFEWVLNPNEEVASMAARTIHRLFPQHRQLTRVSLAASLRHLYLIPKNLDLFLRFDKEIQTSLFCLASENGNGYVREAALDRLADFPSPAALPFILYRLADWVQVVRTKAEKTLQDWLKVLDPMELVPYFYAFNWMLTVGRNNLKPLHASILDSIFNSKNLPALLAGMKHRPERVRFFMAKQMAGRGFLEEDTLQVLLRDKNYLIRMIAVQHLDFEQGTPFLKFLLRDKSQKVRSYAIEAIPPDNVLQLQDELEKSLMDASASIREHARDLLGATGQYDFPGFYSQKVAEEASSGAVLGMAEVGNEHDVLLIQSFLDAPAAKVRAAALVGLASLDLRNAQVKALIILPDPSCLVKKSAVKILAQEKVPADLLALRKIYVDAGATTKRYCLKAISTYGGWSIAGDFLRGIVEEDKALREHAGVQLDRWDKYSSRLGTDISEQDRSYVMHQYQLFDLENYAGTPHLTRIVKEIPFRFRF